MKKSRTYKIVWILFLTGIVCCTAGCQSMDNNDSNKTGKNECTDNTNDTNPDAPEYSRRTLSVELTVPNPAWSITIEEVWVKEKECWVIARTKREEGVMAAQVITDVEDSVTVSAPDYPRKTFIYGKTWNWERNTGPSVTFIENPSEIAPQLQGAERIYPSSSEEK